MRLFIRKVYETFRRGCRTWFCFNFLDLKRPPTSRVEKEMKKMANFWCELIWKLLSYVCVQTNLILFFLSTGALGKSFCHVWEPNGGCQVSNSSSICSFTVLLFYRRNIKCQTERRKKLCYQKTIWITSRKYFFVSHNILLPSTQAPAERKKTLIWKFSTIGI